MSTGHAEIYDDDALPQASRQLARIRADHPEFEEFLNEDYSFSHKWDIPWVAGRNLSCSRIYVDRHCQIIRKIRKNSGGSLSVNITPFLAHHERPEFFLMHRLGWEYEPAHHVATVVEKEAVEAVGLHWNSYRNEMRKDIKKDEDPRIDRCPPDLDVEPYEEGASPKLVKRILDAMGRQKRRSAHTLFMRR
jgi:hypothetical protein